MPAYVVVGNLHKEETITAADARTAAHLFKQYFGFTPDEVLNLETREYHGIQGVCEKTKDIIFDSDDYSRNEDGVLTLTNFD